MSWSCLFGRFQSSTQND